MIGQTGEHRCSRAPGHYRCIALLLLASLSGTVVAEETLSLPRQFQRRGLAQTVAPERAAELAAQLVIVYDQAASGEQRLAAGQQVRQILANPDCADLRSSVERRVELVETLIQAEQLSAADDEHKQLLRRLVSATSRYEDSSSEADADAVRAAWSALKDSAEVMALVRPVMMQHYFNHNMHITLSEHMLTKFVSDYRTQHGSIAECILGAWVTGSQVTNASVSADIKRSSGQAQFLLRLHGQTSSNTAGRRKPATIFTRGNHTFDIAAPVFFDGESLTTGDATVDVNTRNTTVGVKTDLDWIPLFGALARNIARQKAQEKRGQSEYIAAQKIARRAVPEFLKEANEKFAEANAGIRDDLFAGLNAKGVGPDSFSARSSETHLAVSTRTIGTARLGGTAQPFAPLPTQGLAIQVHETAFNNVIDGLMLNGRTIPEDQFFDILGQSLSELLQKDIQLTGGDEQEDAASDEPQATFQLSEQDPVRIRFEHNSVVLVLQLKLSEEGKDPLPAHRIELPIGISVQGNSVVFSPPEKLTSIRATALEEVSRARRIGIANQIRRVLSKRLPERTIDGVFSVKASDDRTIDLHTVSVSSHDGWLYFEMQ